MVPLGSLLVCVALLTAPQTTARRDGLRGVNVVWGVSGSSAAVDYQYKAPLLVRRMQEAGITVTRIGISWADIERQRGRYDWAETDRLVDFLRAHGLELLACFCTTPRWAWGVGEEVVQLFQQRGCAHLLGVLPPDRKFWSDYRQYCQAVARHFRGRVRLYEFWNEPDGMGMPLVVYDQEGHPKDIRWGGDPTLYAELLRLTYQSLKAGDPHCRVAVGGLDGRPRLSFLQGLYAAGGQRYFDALCVHPYPYRSEDLAWDWVDALREVMVSHGDAHKPIWITEYGWSSVPAGQFGATEYGQARLLAQSILAMRQRPFIQLATYHTLNDWRTDEANPASVCPMGLCDYDLRPKPAFHSFRLALSQPASVNQLRNPGFESAGELAGVARYWTNTDGQAHPAWYAVDTQMRRHGHASQRLTWGPGARADLTVWQMTPVGSVYAGRRYRASVWCRVQGLRQRWGGLRLAVRFFDAAGTMLAEYRAPLDRHQDADWHQVSLLATAPRGALRAQIVLYLHAESGTVWYDDASFHLQE
jgi:hypothetical protein